MIALCLKCYFVEEQSLAGKSAKHKLSTKGMTNVVTRGRFKSALNGSKDMASKRGFRMRYGR